MYRIYIGDGKCEKCGRKHKKIFEIDGKIYGSSCAREVLGLNLTAPLWLYKMADDYVQKKIKNNEVELRVEDFECNFWNEMDNLELGKQDGYDGAMIYTKACKVNGKRVSIEWQYEMAHYLNQKWDEVKQK